MSTMKVSVEQLSAIERKVRVELPQETVRRELDKAYRELSRTVKIKGFRPGKVPLDILKRRFGTQVENEVGLQKVQGDIQAEELRSQLIELQRQHTRVEAEADGEGEARKILIFFEVLGDQLTPTDKTALFNILRQQDKIEALSSGNARVFITPQNASLQLDVES